MILGIAGKSGSGKNLLASYLVNKGFFHVDLDQYSHAILLEKAEDLAQLFGRHILDARGAVNRRKLGSIVFSKPEKKEKLQAFLYPILEEKVKKEILLHQNIILNGALLSESVLADLCDSVIWVKSSAIRCLYRLRKRDSRKISELLQRMKSQRYLKPQLFFNRVDIEIIKNQGNPRRMFRQVDNCLEL